MLLLIFIRHECRYQIL